MNKEIEVSGTVRISITIAVAVVLVSFIVAACVVTGEKERTKLLTHCLEKTEKPIECKILVDFAPFNQQ